MTKQGRIVLALLLAVDAALLLAIATRPLPILDNITMMDDSYLSLGVARNIALGKGPLQGLAYTNGFQPLYVFLMVPVYAFWPTDMETPVRVAVLFGAACNVATLALLFLWLRRMTGSIAVAAVPCVGWICAYPAVYESLNGLETSLSVLLIVASFDVFHRLLETPDDPRLRRLLGVVLGLAMFARVDNALLIAVIGGAVLLRRVAKLDQLLEVAGIIAIINLPWWLYSFHYTGHVFPESGAAVRFRSLAGTHDSATIDYIRKTLWRGGRDVLRMNREILIAAGICLVWSWLAPKVKASSGPPPSRWIYGALAVWAIVHFTAYTCYVFGPWYFQRYLFPLIIPLLVLLACAWRRVVESLRPNMRGTIATGLAFVLAISLLARKQIKFALTATETRRFGYMNPGLWARDHFPPGTRIGAVQSGGIGYFAPNLTVVNLDGVVNAAALQALREHRTVDYIRSSHIEALMDWASDTSFLLIHSAPGDDQFLEDEGPIPGFRSFNQEWHIYRVE